MRYIAKVLKNSLHEKFPDASEDELMKVEVLESTVVTVYLYARIKDSAHSARAVPRKVQIMPFCHYLADCWKPSLLPLHESSHRGS